MARRVKQFRFYKDDNSNNYPNNVKYTDYINGHVFNGYYPISQLGIQTLPGTKFYLNDSPGEEPVIIGFTGIYELDLSNKTEITKIQFDENSMNNINNNDNAYLLVDIIYEQEQEEE